MKRGARGQALTEVALGSLVFITILVFGIHFAEIGVLKLRAQQAATKALWDTTGVRHHRLESSGEYGEFFKLSELKKSDGSAFDPALDAEQAFNNLSSNAGMRLALTKGSRLNVTCRAMQVEPNVANQPVEQQAAGARAHAFRFPSDGDGLRCNASARINLVGVPTDFLNDSAGFFQVPQADRPQFSVCAFGRRQGGACRGGVMLATDDWGLSGHSGSQPGMPTRNESGECGWACNYAPDDAPLPYRNTVNRVYRAYTRRKDLSNFYIDEFVKTLFVTSVAAVPVDERDFRFVFIGGDSTAPKSPGSTAPDVPFNIASLEAGHYNEPNRSQIQVREWDNWATTPFSTQYKAAWNRRGNCYLGHKCSGSVFDR